MRIRIALKILLCGGLLWWGFFACSPPGPGTENGLPDGSTGDVDSRDTKPDGSTGCKQNADCKEPGKPKCAEGRCVPECSLDVHCADSAKPKCLGGVCKQEPVPACKVDTDCTDSTKPVCKDGVCIARPKECSNDPDCKDPTKPVCKSGQCVPKEAECQTSVDCLDPRLPVCVAGKCGLAPSQCQSDGDCFDSVLSICRSQRCVAECTSNKECADPTKPVCNDGRCAAKGAACRGNLECKEASHPLCVEGFCSISSACLKDDECKDPVRPRCIEGRCGPQCIQQNDCGKTERCLHGKCVPSCKTNEECLPEGRTLCAGGQCVMACLSDSECSGDKPTCVHGNCIKKGGCADDSTCTKEKPRCDVTTGECQVCALELHCAFWQACDRKTFTCVAKAGYCADDAGCASSTDGKFCVKNRCVACKADTDCKKLFGCQENKCVEVGCRLESDCAPKFCQYETGVCATCAGDAQCAAGERCDKSKGTCSKLAACTKDTDCNDASYAHCDTARSLCTECKVAGDCAANVLSKNSATCTAGRCVECKDHTECLLGGLCTAGKCVGACMFSRDCPKDRPICSNKRMCVECSVDTDCPGGMLCNQTSFVCELPCLKDDDCSKNTTNTLCNVGLGRCTPCLPSSEQGAEQDTGCSDPKAPGCDEAASMCVECRVDKHCKASAGATSATCDTKTHTCYECTVDADCSKSYACDKQNRVCVETCKVDSDCVGSKKKTCNTVTSRCVECLQDSNCAQGGRCIKSLLECRDCLSNQDCAQHSEGPACNPVSNLCVGCLKDSDCKSGQKCEVKGMVCVACLQDSDCSNNMTCFEGKCQPGVVAYQGALRWNDGTYAASCAEYRKPTKSGFAPALKDGMYWIQPGRNPLKNYCLMTVSGGGWTLILKADGSKTTFAYDEKIWTDGNSLNPTDVLFDQKEAKLESFMLVSVKDILLMLRTPLQTGALRSQAVSKAGTSMHALINTGKFAKFDLDVGRSSWKQLIGATGSLQLNCNREGLNNNVAGTLGRIRIGIISNEQKDCKTPDSYIGIGAAAVPTVGNLAQSKPDNSDRKTASFGYLFVR